jgi:hypothetical protein
VSCQVTELRHKGVKRKGNRTNRNPATAGMSVMNAELREAACERMGQVLDEHGLYLHLFVYMYLSRKYKHVSASILSVYAFIRIYMFVSYQYLHLYASILSVYVCIITYMFVSCQYKHVCASILIYMPVSDSHILLSEPRWHKRRRTQPSDSPELSDSGDVLMASRYWDRKEEKKTGGCMADGLRCCIWARSQSPGTV